MFLFFIYDFCLSIVCYRTMSSHSWNSELVSVTKSVYSVGLSHRYLGQPPSISSKRVIDEGHVETAPSCCVFFAYACGVKQRSCNAWIDGRCLSSASCTRRCRSTRRSPSKADDTMMTMNDEAQAFADTSVTSTCVTGCKGACSRSALSRDAVLTASSGAAVVAAVDMFNLAM